MLFDYAHIYIIKSLSSAPLSEHICSKLSREIDSTWIFFVHLFKFIRVLKNNNKKQLNYTENEAALRA